MLQNQRVTIINKANELFGLMDHAPYQFIMHHEERELSRFLTFKHRTFQPDDTLYFIHFFRWYYSHHESLESAFLPKYEGEPMKDVLMRFHNLFFSLPEHLSRTKKHVSTPARKSSCKRLNMFLRWMVRRDESGVDFGLWDGLSPSSLMIPLDVHVFKISRQLGLLGRDRPDWQAVEELTGVLREFDSADPVKYDYALFSIGVHDRLMRRKG